MTIPGQAALVQSYLMPLVPLPRGGVLGGSKLLLVPAEPRNRLVLLRYRVRHSVLRIVEKRPLGFVGET